MNALNRAALAILISAIAAGPALGDPGAQPEAPSGARRVKQTIGIGRLFDKLLGKESRRPKADDDMSTTPANDESPPADDAANGPNEPATAGSADASSEPASRGSTAATTPTIQVEAPLRIRLPDNRTEPAVRIAGRRPEETEQGADSATETAPGASDEGLPSEPVADGAAMPRATRGVTPPAVPAVPIITARPAPAPKFVDAAAPRQPSEEAMPSRRMARSANATQAAASPVPTPGPGPSTPVAARPAPPIAAPRRPSTTGFLSHEARFGKVVRRPQVTPAQDLSDDIAPESVATFRTPPVASVARLANVAPSIASQPLLAEDFAPLEPLRPRGLVTGAPAGVEGATTSPNASARQILRALHSYGSPTLPAVNHAGALAPVAMPSAQLPTAPAGAMTQPTPASESVLKPTAADNEPASREL